MIIKIIDNLMKIMYPGYFRDTSHKIYIMENSTRVLIEDTLFRLNKQIELALKYSPDYENADDCELHVEAQRLTVAFFHTLPKIRALLETICRQPLTAILLLTPRRRLFFLIRSAGDHDQSSRARAVPA